MTTPDFLPGWYPLMRSRALGARSVFRPLAGTVLQLARSATGEVDACDARTGVRRAALDSEGWILAALGEPLAEADAPDLAQRGPLCRLYLEGQVRAALCDVAENILDTTHTSVVHHGYLRRPDRRRTVQAKLESGASWVAATYPPDAAPGGWGARLIGTQGYTITDCFQSPSIADVTYRSGERLVFTARFRLAPVSADETYVAATLALPGSGLGARLRLAALRLFFVRILAEDRAILELIGANRRAHGAAPLAYAPHDVLRPGIEAILAGRAPPSRPSRVALRV